jgi:hypothetical protein
MGLTNYAWFLVLITYVLMLERRRCGGRGPKEIPHMRVLLLRMVRAHNFTVCRHCVKERNESV